MDPACLLSDEAFARRIAYGLLRDRDAAEDLVQEAWVEILKRPPRHAAGLRSYLALVLRRLWSGKRTADASRLAREALAAQGEAQEETSALVARAEVHKRTVAAVLALDEPYRTTVLLRFFEDLTFAEIAAREGVPLETARTRMKRAMALLRANLEREGSDWREEWALALSGSRSFAPGREPPAERAPVRHVGLAAGSATLVASAFLAWYLRLEPEREHSSLPAAAPALTLARNETESPPVEHSPARTSVRPAPADEVRSTPPEPAPFLTGRVSDSAGRPLSGVHLQLALERYHTVPALVAVRSDEQGRFTCSLAAWSALGAHQRGLFRLMLEAWSPGHVPLTHFVELPDEARDVVLVLEPGRVLSGRALDAGGDPVEGARVVARCRAREGRERTARGLTDLEGWFAIGLEAGEALLDVELWEALRGCAYLAGNLPANTSGDIELGASTLRPRHALRGRCTSPDGSPVRNVPLQLIRVEPAPAGGFVRAVGADSERALGRAEFPLITDELGRFETRALRPGTYQILCDGTPLEDGAVWDADGPPIGLVLERRQLTVEVEGPDGRLLDEARIAVTRLASPSRPAGTSLRTLTGGEPPAAIVTVDAGEELAVLAVVPGCASVEERVSIGPASFATRLRMRLAPEERRATLALRPDAGAPEAWSIALCAPLSGLPLPGWQDLAPDPSGEIHALPRGAYRVRIEARLARTDTADALPQHCFARGDTLVSLTDGKTALEFPVLPSARVRVRFGAPSSIAPAPAAFHGSSGVGSDLWSWLGASLSARGILEIRAPDLDAERPLQRLTGLRPRAGQFLELLVPAVPLQLSLELDGRPFHQAPLAPEAGETLEVPVPLPETAPSR